MRYRLAADEAFDATESANIEHVLLLHLSSGVDGEHETHSRGA